MLLVRFVAKRTLVLSIAVLCSSLADAQKYPDKPIRVLTAEAGGGSDAVARLLGQELSLSLGQPIIVDNRGGIASIPAQIVAKARPDGYTLLSQPTTFWLLPLLQDNIPYDPTRDFSAITSTARSPNLLVIQNSLPIKSVRELIALAKNKPGALNYGSSGNGTALHLAAELFKSMAGVNIVRVSYKGAGPALNGLVGGEVQLAFPPAAAATPYIKAGKLAALAVTSLQRSVLFPDLPTVAQTVPGYESGIVYVTFAPAGTPSAIIDLLNREIIRVISKPDIKEKFLSLGLETIGSSPQQLMTRMKSDITATATILKNANIGTEQSR